MEKGHIVIVVIPIIVDSLRIITRFERFQLVHGNRYSNEGMAMFIEIEIMREKNEN